MTKKRLFFFFLIFLFVIVLYMFWDTNVHEEIYDSDLVSGDVLLNDTNHYEIYVTDDKITFNDPMGNSIIYVFEDDRLENVFSLYNAKNDVEAKKIANYFETQIGSGEIHDVNRVGTTVSVQMDINYFSQYKDFTKKQIEEILLKDAEAVEEDVIYEGE